MVEPRLLTEDEVEEIRAGVKMGLRGPVQTKWLEQLLDDHDERVRRERLSPERLRGRYGDRRSPEPDPH